MPFLDSFERPISYLRISVTDRCNFRCLYCRPAEGIDLRRSHEILRFEEIERVARAAASLGINKVRLTGGEPRSAKMWSIWYGCSPPSPVSRFLIRSWRILGAAKTKLVS